MIVTSSVPSYPLLEHKHHPSCSVKSVLCLAFFQLLKMSHTPSEANKQGISRLITKCNNDYNANYQTKGKLKPSDNTRTLLAEIGLKHAKEIIDIAKKYAYHRSRQASKSTSKGKNGQKSNKFNRPKTEIIIKIESCDILNAISYLNLPLSRQMVYKFTTIKKSDNKQSLNALFLKWMFV